MNLRQWRTKRKLTMAQAAEIIGVSQPTVSRIERGSQFPGPETVELLIKKTEGAITAAALHRAWQSINAARAA